MSDLAQALGGAGALALAVVGRKLIPLLRLHIRIALDTRRRVRRLETLLTHGDDPGHGHAPDPRPDELERRAERILGDASADG